MRFVAKVIIAFVALMGIGGTANAATFDGTNWNAEYTTGITEVSLNTDQGILAIVPVYSLPHCIDEDLAGEPCVWISPERGNGEGTSFVKLGTEENRLTASIPNWTAEILLDPQGISIAEIQAYKAQRWPELFAPIVSTVEVAPISFETVAPTAEPVQEMTTEELGMTVSEFEAMNVTDPEQEIVSEDPDNLDDIISDIHADKTGVNMDHEGMDICELEQCEDNVTE